MVVGRGWIAACAVATLMAGLVAGPRAAAATASCAAGWQAETVASNLDGLENLDSDGHGGLYVAGLLAGRLYHVDATHHVTTLVSGLDHPAGMRLTGHLLYFVTGDGNTPAGGGTLRQLDLKSGVVTTLLANLSNPNGLLLLPDGDLLIAHGPLLIPPQGISRYRPSTGVWTQHWSNTPFPNGLALTPDHKAIYTENDFASQILRIPLDTPNNAAVVAHIDDGVLPGLDDMDVTGAGVLYVAGDASGSVYQVAPETGGNCTIATGWISRTAGPIPPVGPTSIRLVRDGSRWSLYVTLIDGTVRQLRPPLHP